MPMTHKNLIIRADANTYIGIGHVMRCIALAQAWQDQGGDVTFLSHCDSDGLRQRIIEESFEFIPIEKPHPDPYDLIQTLSVLKLHALRAPRSAPCWLVLDGYHFGPDYQKAIHKAVYRVLVLDDYNHLPHYHADILVNQNIHTSSLHYSCDRNTVKLLGPEYALLRREFLKYSNCRRKFPEKARKILVTMGGSDPDNVTLKVIKALNKLDDHDLEVKIVVGPSNPNIERLKSEISLSAFSFQLLASVKDMPAVMSWADISVTAGGSTCWEIAYMGLPNCTIVLADNQVPVAKILQKIRVSVNLGWFRSIDPTNFAQIIGRLVQDCGRREAMSVRGKSIITGRGSQNVVRAMSEH